MHFCEIYTFLKNDDFHAIFCQLYIYIYINLRFSLFFVKNHICISMLEFFGTMKMFLHFYGHMIVLVVIFILWSIKKSDRLLSDNLGQTGEYSCPRVVFLDEKI